MISTMLPFCRALVVYLRLQSSVQNLMQYFSLWNSLVLLVKIDARSVPILFFACWQFRVVKLKTFYSIDSWNLNKKTALLLSVNTSLRHQQGKTWPFLILQMTAWLPKRKNISSPAKSRGADQLTLHFEY